MSGCTDVYLEKEREGWSCGREGTQQGMGLPGQGVRSGKRALCSPMHEVHACMRMYANA